MIVTKTQEKNITYSPSSALNSDLHPVRPGAKASYEDEEITEEDANEEPEAESNESKTEEKGTEKSDESKEEVK